MGGIPIKNKEVHFIEQLVDQQTNLAIMKSSLISEYLSNVNTHFLEVTIFQWLISLAGALEQEISADVKKLRKKINQDFNLIIRIADLIFKLEKYAIHGRVNDLIKVSDKIEPLTNDLEDRISLRYEEVWELIQRISKLSGTKIPKVSIDLIRPRKLSKITEGIKRFLSGYAKEKLQK